MTEVALGGQPSALDTPQEFTDASSYRVRDELAGLIELALADTVIWACIW